MWIIWMLLIEVSFYSLLTYCKLEVINCWMLEWTTRFPGWVIVRGYHIDDEVNGKVNWNWLMGSYPEIVVEWQFRQVICFGGLFGSLPWFRNPRMWHSVICFIWILRRYKGGSIIDQFRLYTYRTWQLPYVAQWYSFVPGKFILARRLTAGLST